MSTLKLNTTSGGSVNLVPDDTAANLIISPQTGYYLPAGTGAVATTVQTKLRESVSVQDFGGSSAGVINNDTPMANALAASSVVVVPASGIAYAGTAVTIPANKILTGENAVGPTVNATFTVSSGSEISELALASPATVIAPASNLQGVLVDRLIGTTANYAVNITSNTYTHFGVDVKDCVITSTGYPVLTGANGGFSPLGSGLVRITGNTLSSVNADGIELNYPKGRPKGFIVANNFVSMTGASGASTGFGIGAAAVEQAVFVGNVVTAADKEAFHLEDSYKQVSVVANSFYGQSHGVNVGPLMQVGETSRPATFVGNTAANNLGATGYGYYLFYTSPSTVQAHTLVGNVASNYAAGVHIGAADGGLNALNYVGGNSFDTCTAAVQGTGNANAYWTVQKGENVAINCTYLFKSGANCFFGKVYSSTTPTAVFSSPSYTTKMPSRCEGFAFPTPSAITINGAFFVYNFPIGGRVFGRFKYSTKGTGTNNWAHYSGTIKWDGTTLTVTDELFRGNGVITAMHLEEYLGNLYVGMSATASSTLNSGWLEFDGEWWDA